MDLEQFRWWLGKEIKREKGREAREDRREKKDEVKKGSRHDNSRNQQKKLQGKFEM